MDDRSMQKVRSEINKLTFEYDREDRALKAIELIYSLCCSRDYDGLDAMQQTKLGKAFLDIAEVYGENAPACRKDFRF